jgi:hypothetical protein
MLFSGIQFHPLDRSREIIHFTLKKWGSPMPWSQPYLYANSGPFAHHRPLKWEMALLRLGARLLDGYGKIVNGMI